MAAGGLLVNFPDGVPAATNHEAAGRLGPSSIVMSPVYPAPAQPAGNEIVDHEQADTALPPIAFGLVYRRAVVERDAPVASLRRAGRRSWLESRQPRPSPGSDLVRN
jgi:hypothetical protein